MPPEVRRCDDHGYFDGERCPVCESAGERVLSGDRRRRLSKYLSGALRHFPGDAGLSLDEAGWTAFDDLVTAAARQYDWADRVRVEAVVATDPKGRFERTGSGGADGAGGRTDPGGAGEAAGAGGTAGANETADASDADGATDRVRAAYGHSVDVALDAGTTPVPETLYHGTAPRNLDAIAAEGLRPMDRQQVHLSESVADAREVGRRHADDPVILAVDAAALRADGYAVTKRGRTVYTTDRVPPAYLSEISDGD